MSSTKLIFADQCSPNQYILRQCSSAHSIFVSDPLVSCSPHGFRHHFGGTSDFCPHFLSLSGYWMSPHSLIIVSFLQNPIYRVSTVPHIQCAHRMKPMYTLCVFSNGLPMSNMFSQHTAINQINRVSISIDNDLHHHQIRLTVGKCPRCVTMSVTTNYSNYTIHRSVWNQHQILFRVISPSVFVTGLWTRRATLKTETSTGPTLQPSSHTLCGVVSTDHHSMKCTHSIYDALNTN